MLLKLGVLVAIIAAVIFGFRIIERRIKGAKAPQAPTVAPPIDDSQAMARCATCQTYVPAEGARGCGRAECPYPA